MFALEPSCWISPEVSDSHPNAIWHLPKVLYTASRFENWRNELTKIIITGTSCISECLWSFFFLTGGMNWPRLYISQMAAKSRMIVTGNGYHLIHSDGLGVVIWMRLQGMNRCIVSRLLYQFLVARIGRESCACVHLACACLSTTRAALAWSSTVGLLKCCYNWGTSHAPIFPIWRSRQILSACLPILPSFIEDVQSSRLWFTSLNYLHKRAYIMEKK